MKCAEMPYPAQVFIKMDQIPCETPLFRTEGVFCMILCNLAEWDWQSANTRQLNLRPGFSNSTSDHTFLYNATKANNIHQCQLINAELITYREHRLEDYFSCMLHINRQAFTRPFFCIPTILWLNLSTIITNLIITMFGHFDIFSQMDLCHQNSNIYIELKY